MKCPHCGHELPGVSHFGLKAHPKNYITSPLYLTPGKLYLYRFSLLYYPPRMDPQLGRLSDCLVIANEEVPKDGSRLPFVSGSKFYSYELEKLEEAVNKLIAAEVALQSIVTGRSVSGLMHARISQMYSDTHYRHTMMQMADSMLQAMARCRRITESEG